MTSPPIPEFKDFVPTPEDFQLIYELEREVFKKAYELIKEIVEYKTSPGNPRELQIATCESLTAGLIMSTLVHVPYGGNHKYGCFGVYDTDAKRVFSGVKVSDVYTHTCAREMAVGLLKNSNATITISVSGNAMPSRDQLNRLGELFIGVAGYKQKTGEDHAKATTNSGNENDVEIIYETRSSSECLERHDNLGNRIKKNCQLWIDENATRYAPRAMTASISRLIRNYTALSAMQFAIDFLQKNKDLIVPNFVVEAKERNQETQDNLHKHLSIPPSKYPLRNDIKETCTNNVSKVNNTYNVCGAHNAENQYGIRWDIKDYNEVRGTAAIRAAHEEADLVKKQQDYALELQKQSEGGKKFREKKRNTRRKKRRSKKNIPKRNNKKLSHKKVHI